MTTKRYRKSNKSNYNTFDDLDQLGFGSWLKKNAGVIGTVTGAAIGTVIAPGIGTSLGASIGGSMGGAAQQNNAEQEQNEAQNKMVAQQNAQSQANSQLQQQLNQKNNVSFAPTMRHGGKVMANRGNTSGNRTYYINTPSEKIQVGENELNDIKAYLGAERKISSYYDKTYGKKVDNIKKLMKEGNYSSYDEFVKKNPNLAAPSIAYKDFVTNNVITPEEEQLLFKYRNKFIPSSKVKGENEPNIDLTTDTLYGYRNRNNVAELFSSINFENPFKVTPYNYQPLKGHPHMYIEYGDTTNVNTPTAFVNEMGTKVPIDPQKGFNMSSYNFPENFQYAGEDKWKSIKRQQNSTNTTEPYFLTNPVDENILKEQIPSTQPIANTKHISTRPVFRTGGTINYTGQYHEGPNGGVPVDGNGNYNPVNPSALVEKGEVGYTVPEGGTYIFSNNLELNKNKTFAKEAKNIQKRYKLRMNNGKVNDDISREGYNKDMKNLKDIQEAYRHITGVDNEDENPPEAKNGIYIKPSKIGTFTAAARKHGMGVQEFARKVLANKEDYSTTMVKKANFAHNAVSWKHEDGGALPQYEYGDYLSMRYPTPTGTSMLPEDQMRFGYNNLNLNTTLPTFIDYTKKSYDKGNYPTPTGTSMLPEDQMRFGYNNLNLNTTLPTFIDYTKKSYDKGNYPTFQETVNSLSGNDNTTTNNSSKDNYSTYQGLSPLEAGIPAIVSAASNLWLANRSKRYSPKKLQLAKQVPRTISLENERNRLIEQGNIARAMNKRALLESGASPSQYTANVGAGNIGVQRTLGEELGKSYQSEALANQQAQEEADRINAQMDYQEQLYNSQVEAAQKARTDQYRTNAATSIMGGFKDYYSSRDNAAYLNALNPNIEYVQKNPRWWSVGKRIIPRERY